MIVFDRVVSIVEADAKRFEAIWFGIVCYKYYMCKKYKEILTVFDSLCSETVRRHPAWNLVK